MTTTLIVPGLNSSGPAHWQSWFETRIPDAVRVVQRDWKRPDLAQWSSRVRREISRHSGGLLIVAHSFGVLAAVQAADDYRGRIGGALLVAPADPDKFGVADLLPQAPLDFPSVIVASSNDPWLRLERARHYAALWGADLVSLGAAGHINTEAGYGPWPEGLALLQHLQLDGARKANRALLEQTRVQTAAGRTAGAPFLSWQKGSGDQRREPRPPIIAEGMRG